MAIICCKLLIDRHLQRIAAIMRKKRKKDPFLSLPRLFAAILIPRCPPPACAFVPHADHLIIDSNFCQGRAWNILKKEINHGWTRINTDFQVGTPRRGVPAKKVGGAAAPPYQKG